MALNKETNQGLESKRNKDINILRTGGRVEIERIEIRRSCSKMSLSRSKKHFMKRDSQVSLKDGWEDQLTRKYHSEENFIYFISLLLF